MNTQALVDKAVAVATENGYPPELTHKMHLFDTKTIKGLTDAETVVRNLIEGYHSKAGLIEVFTALVEELSGIE